MIIDSGNPMEFQPPAAIQPVRDALLQAHLAHCLARSPFYRRKLAGVRPEEITVDAIGQLPTTSKAEFAEFNTEFLAVPSDQVADIVFTSGTTGEPTPVMYTSGDMERLAFNEALSFAACGVTSADTALLTCTMDRCFVAGMAYYLGLRHLGAAVLRNGLGSLESHADVIRRMRPTLVVGVPTFLRRLGQHLEAKGFAPDRMGVRALVCIGEPLRDAALAPLPVATDIERLWGAPVHSTYASSEVVTSFCECSARRGGHLHPELCVVEILGDDGRPVPAGMIGEVTLTPLGLEGMPLVRFRTGDVSFLIDEPCSCGRLSPRLGPIIGRRNQLMKVNGTSLYPQAVQTALDLIPGLGEYYLVAGSQDTLSDSITIHASVRDSSLTVAAIMQLLQARLRVKPNVVIEPEAEILKQVFSAHSRKPIRFIDRRENQ
jgi:phenylacetate-CoA ligase